MSATPGRTPPPTRAGSQELPVEVLESMADIFCAVDADWRFTYVNAQAEAAWGRRREDLLGRDLWSEFPDAAGDESRRWRLQAMAERAPVDYETFSPLLGRWVAVNLHPARDGGLFVRFRDIGARKQGEEALAESVRQLAQQTRIFHTTLSAIADFAYIFDRAGRFLFANRALVELLGLGVEEIVGKDFHDLPYPRELAERLQRQIRQVLETGETLTDETPFTNPSGQTGVYEYIFRPVRSVDGATVEFVAGSTRDITARKQAEEALREFEERLCALIKASSDALYRMNADWSELRQLNGGSFIAATRKSPRDWLQEYVHPDDQPRISTVINEAIRAMGVFELEHRVRRVDGKWGWTFSRAVPLRDADGEIVEWFGAASDVTARKQAEAALQASEAQLGALVESAPLGVYLLDADFRIRQVNPAARPVFGDIPDLIGQDFDEVIHLLWPQEYADEIVALFRHTLETGEPYFVPERIEKRRDREAVEYYEWQINRIPLPDGRHGVVCYFRDISAPVFARQAIARSEARLQRALAVETVGVFFLRPDGAITDANDAFLAMTGHTREELAAGAVRWDEITPPEWMPATRRAMAEMEATGRIAPYEKQLTHKSGSRWWGLFAGTRVSVEEGVEFVLDITAQRETEAVLAVSQERLRLVLENAREYAIFSLDSERRVTSWNSGAQAILGHAEAEILGQSGDVIFTPEDRADGAPEEETRTALAEGRAADERWHVRKDGSRFWGSGVMMAMRDARGEAIGFAKIFRDLTERRAAEEERERLLLAEQAARAEAEAANVAKDRFLAVLSHELRTPLAPLPMALYALGREKRLSAAGRVALEMIGRNLQAETRLIDDLLDVSRIVHGKLELAPAPLDLHAVIEHALEVCREDLLANGLRLTVRLDAPRHQTTGDAARLRQVFWNLFRNAAKFTPEGGAVAVRSRNADPDRFVLEVADTGVGIAPELLPRLFDAFEQGGPEVVRRFGGLGLGLSIAHAIVEAHGGRLTAASEGSGRGAVFTVELSLMA